MIASRYRRCPSVLRAGLIAVVLASVGTTTAAAQGPPPGKAEDPKQKELQELQKQKQQQQQRQPPPQQRAQPPQQQQRPPEPRAERPRPPQTDQRPPQQRPAELAPPRERGRDLGQPPPGRAREAVPAQPAPPRDAPGRFITNRPVQPPPGQAAPQQPQSPRQAAPPPSQGPAEPRRRLPTEAPAARTTPPSVQAAPAPRGPGLPPAALQRAPSGSPPAVQPPAAKGPQAPAPLAAPVQTQPPAKSVPSGSAVPTGAAGAAAGAAAAAAAASATASPAATSATPRPQRIEQVRQGRVQSAGPGGQTVITEPGNRTIIKQDNRTFITRNETTVIQQHVPGARSTPRPGGITETVYARPGGVQVFSETDSSGRLLRRYRRDPGGREVNFVDNRKFYRNLAIGIGVGAVAAAAIVALAPPRVVIPRERYIVDYDRASDDDIYETLRAPPVERLERTYSLDEIRYSEPLRARMRRIDLDGITFEIGSFEVSPDQFRKLERIARAISRTIDENPAEVFLIEGHTDAVGAPEDNLSLSDRRAESVARILVEEFGIPIENLTTQGYGEQHLKIDTAGPERLNRRVAVRRITPLLSQREEP